MPELTHTTVVPEEGLRESVGASPMAPPTEALTVPTYQKRNRIQIEPKQFKKEHSGRTQKRYKGKKFSHITQKPLC